MSLTVCSVVRDEAGRFLKRALECWSAYADRILVLDDGSTDETSDILSDSGVEWRARRVRGARDYGDGEYKARSELWEWAADADWVLHLDADQTCAADPRPHLSGVRANFRLYDLWSPTAYRSDAWWRGHARCWWPAVHMPSVPSGFRPDWAHASATGRPRQWHSPNFPPNLGGHATEMPLECSILHYAYVTDALRAEKAALYADLAPHLTESERFHASTILDERPRLLALPFEPDYTLL